MTYRQRLGWIVAALALVAAPLSTVRAERPPTVVGVDLVSRHNLPADQVRGAIGELTDRPRSRTAVRESLDRLWALGLFSRLWVEEVSERGGVRLRFHLERAPFIRSIRWNGQLAVDPAELAAVAGLAVGGSASEAPLEKAVA
jgi:outer membrane protein assembly factor BamA